MLLLRGMSANPAPLFLALLAAQPANEPGLLVATDKDFSTSVRLVESDDTVRFEIRGPESVAPGIAIDVNRNGKIDRDIDFQVGFETDGSQCLIDLLSESEASTCKPLGAKAQIAQIRSGATTITTFTFPKRAVSSDGYGFGFAIDLWNKMGNYGSVLASGDYRFGGQVHLVTDGPNFKGQENPRVPPQMMAALRRYQGCLSASISKIEPLDETKLDELYAITAGCTSDRSAAVDEGVGALVAGGVGRDEAMAAMKRALDQLDAGIANWIKLVKEKF